MKTVAALLSSILLMSCDKGVAPSSPARAIGVDAVQVHGGPFAFVIPSAQKDPLAAAKLLEVLRLGGVEVQRARVTTARCLCRRT